MRPHLHENHHECIIVLSGQLEVRIKNTTLVANPSELLFYPQNEVHEERSIGSDEMETLFVSWSNPNINTASWPNLFQDKYGRIQMLGRWMYEMYCKGSTFEKPEIHLLLDALITELSHSTVEQAAQDKRMEKVFKYIQSHLSAEIQLNDLAKAANLSPFHFSRYFHKYAGTSPMRFIRKMRLEKVRQLLLQTNLPLRVIAPQAGFNDEYQLSHCYRKMYGHSPGALRKLT